MALRQRRTQATTHSDVESVINISWPSRRRPFLLPVSYWCHRLHLLIKGRLAFLVSVLGSHYRIIADEHYPLLSQNMLRRYILSLLSASLLASGILATPTTPFIPSIPACCVKGYHTKLPFDVVVDLSLSWVSCATRCGTKSNCKSITWGGGLCQLYTTPVSVDFKVTVLSPFVACDLSCAVPPKPTSTSSKITSSTPTASSSSTSSSATPVCTPQFATCTATHTITVNSNCDYEVSCNSAPGSENFSRLVPNICSLEDCALAASKELGRQGFTWFQQPYACYINDNDATAFSPNADTISGELVNNC